MASYFIMSKPASSRSRAAASGAVVMVPVASASPFAGISKADKTQLKKIMSARDYNVVSRIAKAANQRFEPDMFVDPAVGPRSSHGKGIVLMSALEQPTDELKVMQVWKGKNQGKWKVPNRRDLFNAIYGGYEMGTDDRALLYRVWKQKLEMHLLTDRHVRSEAEYVAEHFKRLRVNPADRLVGARIASSASASAGPATASYQAHGASYEGDSDDELDYFDAADAGDLDELEEPILP